MTGIADVGILCFIGGAIFLALRFLKKNGSGCGGCSGDCSRCRKRK